ncbi:uncharacterized protein LOC106462406 isoform X2 [Limulus polyphemus]|uniref:Pseudouridylate synthase RPUSD4, mitochondrial n=1 Tax=Limulus polyphemus TaxID=6850 RepID=A0ABM1SP09_LIMPO|nr:uncharacterized protein LOC106462406 isoform X2 [Limulus polyphemus]
MFRKNSCRILNMAAKLKWCYLNNHGLFSQYVQSPMQYTLVLLKSPMRVIFPVAVRFLRRRSYNENEKLSVIVNEEDKYNFSNSVITPTTTTEKRKKCIFVENTKSCKNSALMNNISVSECDHNKNVSVNDFFGIESDIDVKCGKARDENFKCKSASIEKFEYLLRKRDSKVSDDKVIETTYGRVRYDIDNMPHYHEQDEEYSLSETCKTEGESEVLLTNNTNLLGKEIEFQQKSEVDVISREKFSCDEGKGNCDKVVNFKSNLYEDLGFIDQTCFTQSISENPQLSEEKSNDDEATVNLIEDQYFTAAGLYGRSNTENTKEYLKDAQNATPHTLESALKQVKSTQKTSIKELFEQDTLQNNLSTENLNNKQMPKNILNECSTRLVTCEEMDSFIAKTKHKETTKDCSQIPSADKCIDLHNVIQHENMASNYNKTGIKELWTNVHVQTKEEKDDYDGMCTRNILDKQSTVPPSLHNRQSAYDYVMKVYKEDLHKTQKDKNGKKTEIYDERLNSKGLYILKDQIPNWKEMPRDAVLQILKKKILYNDSDIVAIDKPYGIICHGKEDVPVLSSYLSELAFLLDKSSSHSKLYMVHRLDKETTGVMLLARTQQMANHLKKLFHDHKITKVYWALTKGVPSVMEGVIDIPIKEGSVENKRRMVLSPHLPDEYRSLTSFSEKARQAVTHYKVLSTHGNAALIELKPQTGL